MDSIMIAEKLKALKERSGLTVAQWSERSKIPPETINKILQGATKDPRFQTIVDLVLAADGTVDEILDVEKAVVRRRVEMREGDTQQLALLTKAYEDRIAYLSTVVETMRKEREDTHIEHREELKKIQEDSNAILDRFRESHDRIIAAKDAQLKVFQRILIAMVVALIAVLIVLTVYISYDVLSGRLLM